MLVLDDLHWADDASIELLGSLVRRGLAPGVQLALGYRTGRASPRLSATLAAPSVQVIELDHARARHECRTLAGDLAPARHAAIFRESGGNPFYALQLARAAPAARSSSSDRMASGSGVPRSVAAALVEELEALRRPRGRCWTRARSRATRSTPSSPTRSPGSTPDAGVAALDELLETAAAARRPACRGASRSGTRSCGAPSTSPPAAAGGWSPTPARPRRWRRAARAAATRAHHVEQSAVQGDAAAIDVLLEAGLGDRAARTRRRRRAGSRPRCGCSPRPTPPRACRPWSRWRRRSARPATSTHCAARLAEAIELLGPGETGMRVTLVAATAAAEHFLGRHETAERRLAAALETLPDRDSEEAVTVLLAQIAGAFFTLDVTRGLRAEPRRRWRSRSGSAIRC